MKAILKFDLCDFDDKRLHYVALKGIDLAMALFDLSERFRSVEKHDKPPVTRNEFYEVLSKYNINLDELIN